MKISRIHHYNVRCAESDLGAIEKFYGDVAGFRKGPRPGFRNNGIWLYLGDHPILHVTARCPPGFLQDDHRGSVDHIAFESQGAADFRARLDGLGLAYEQQNVAGAGYQIFLKDPVGTTLEFNFANSEAPQEITSGTFADRQQARVA